MAASAEYADSEFNYVDTIQALKHISASNGNIAPLAGRHIAGLKLHCAADDDEEIDGSPAAITTATRDILLKAIQHTHNTADSNAELQLKADTFATSITEADAVIVALRTKLQRMEDDAAALKRIHSTTSDMIVCSMLRSFGQLQQPPPIAAKERAFFRKRCSFGATAVPEVADAAEASTEATEAAEAAEC